MSNGKVGDKDTVMIIITGVKSATGEGRVTRAVDYGASLGAFLEQYGEGTSGGDEPDWNALKAKASNAAELQAAMAQITQDMLGSGAKALPQRIVDATCRYLVEEHNFVISDADPGTDQFFIPKGDLVPSELEVPNDGSSWHVLAAAPFGL